MTSNFPVFALILSVLALVASVLALVLGFGLYRLKKTFLTGKSGADLESTIQNLGTQLRDLNFREENLEKIFSEFRHEASFSIQRLGLVRFNPFQDDGGNFSFCLALLDLHQNGVVITSMHGRQQNRIYTKRIMAGKSESQLTEEEAQAIKLANSQTKISKLKSTTID